MRYRSKENGEVDFLVLDWNYYEKVEDPFNSVRVNGVILATSSGMPVFPYHKGEELKGTRWDMIKDLYWLDLRELEL